jgi:hypothetical protein
MTRAIRQATMFVFSAGDLCPNVPSRVASQQVSARSMARFPRTGYSRVYSRNYLRRLPPPAIFQT